jgi:hypothetical protein
MRPNDVAMALSPNLDFTPVVILGAARSGTNMLRDVLCRLPGAATWPCDEINPIWRHGNLETPHDAFPVEFARHAVRSSVRRRFAVQARRTDARWLVEKTCANTLRVGFVHAILPEARFLRISRDGFDVVPSAMKRWQSSFELGYTLKKVRYVPWSDLPQYLWRFVANRLSRGTENEVDRRMKTWGPRFPGMQDVVRERPLEELCARQWQACEFTAREQLAKVPADQRLSLRYEEFVADPMTSMRAVREFLGADWSDEAMAAATADVQPGSVGNGRRKLSSEQIEALGPYLVPPPALD